MIEEEKKAMAPIENDLSNETLTQLVMEIAAAQRQTNAALSQLLPALRTATASSSNPNSRPQAQSEPIIAVDDRRGKLRAAQALSVANLSVASSLHDDDATTSAAKEEEDSAQLERMTVRIDGIEVYAFVSALTAGTLMSSFDNFAITADWAVLLEKGAYVEITRDVAFLTAGAVGIVSSLHCVLVYSLITIYARTGVGIERDSELETFFRRTGMQRYRGFQSFVLSMYALMIELAIGFASKCPAFLRFPAFLAVLALMYLVYRDTEAIIKEAKIFFTPPTAPKNGGARVQRRRTSLMAPSVEATKEE